MHVRRHITSIRKDTVAHDPSALIRNDEDVIDLQHCVALRSCTLRLYTREMCVPENQSLPHVWDLISQIVSSQLEEIVIEIHEDPMEDLQALDSECGFRELLPVRFDDLLAFDWARIHSILEDTRFRSLKRLVLEGRGEYERARKFVQDRYPPLARLLVFRPESSCFVL